MGEGQHWKHGCYNEGPPGLHGWARLIELTGDVLGVADKGGFVPGADGDSILAAHRDGDQDVVLTDGSKVDVMDAYVELGDKAEAWLNANVAGDGERFGWHDGEFYLWSNADWQAIGPAVIP